ARPVRRRRGAPRARPPALAAPRGLARALAQPGGVDGGPGLRAARANARAAAGLDWCRASRCPRRASARPGSCPVALARVRELTYRYAGADRPALDSVSLDLRAGEVVCLLGPSGGGKSTLLRALAGLVPHFHGGVLSGSVEVAGMDTRRTRPAELAGTVASVFQDPEDQVVLTGVKAEIAFGLENVGTAPARIEPSAAGALDSVGAGHLPPRRTQELSAGELQRVCVAAALALDPQLLLLDEPTSQLDPEGAGELLDVACSGRAVVVSEQRPTLPLERCDRVLFLEGGRLLLDAPHDEALEWLAEQRPA